MDDIAIITATSDRPYAFGLCERWMSRALAFYGGPVTWYVADDGIKPAKCTLGQTHIRRRPSGSMQESFLGNLLAALDRTRERKILFIEDDDWYSEDYIANASAGLDSAEIIGESCAKYYNVASRRYKLWNNTEHASLCQTGIRRSIVKWLQKYILTSDTIFIDIPLWQIGALNSSGLLCPESRGCIGIKGLPGKTGLSEGHNTSGWGIEDPDGKILKKWIGDCDAEIYLNLHALERR